MKEYQAIPVKTWQFYNALKQVVGHSWLTNFFSVSPRHIDRWSCDPDYSESSRRNPMDRYEALLEKLMELGKVDIAQGAVDRQARIVGCHLSCTDTIAADKKTLQEELLDNLPALAAYQDAITTKQPVAEIRAAARRLIDEINQDLTLIEKED